MELIKAEYTTVLCRNLRSLCTGSSRHGNLGNLLQMFPWLLSSVPGLVAFSVFIKKLTGTVKMPCYSIL